MAHLAVPRKGWENEHIATFLLSQIAFVAHPMTVADDVGSDFFCTLFDPRPQGRTQMLFPLNSFAIQVKSSRRNLNATNKIEYLHSLEIPYFVGVVKRSPSRMSVYSGEYLPFMFSGVGPPGKLTLHLVEGEVTASDAYDGTKDGPCNLKLPLVLTLAENGDPETNGRELSKLCSRMHHNISSWKLDEYIFKSDHPPSVSIFAGCRSVECFRDNFCLRLAEVFFNMKWLYEKQRKDFSVAEFEMYDRIYSDLLNNGREMPAILGEAYKKLRGLIDETSQQAPE